MSVEGRAPSPRPGGLHQSWPSGYAAGGVQGPWPFRLVSTTKWVRSAGPDGGLRVDRDHGLARGIIGARSLGTLDRLLQNPEDL